MGYPIYKLLRAVNRQYPNNGFMNHVDVTESIYDDEEKQMIPEDLRDLINETIQEVYKDVALDEVYSFPTVPGQNQYALPEDCDLRDIQEVTRTFAYGPVRPPMGPPPPFGPAPTVMISFFANGGTGTMDPFDVEVGSSFIMPECTLTPPDGKEFVAWQTVWGDFIQPGAQVEALRDETYTAFWKEGDPEYVELLIRNASDDEYTIVVRVAPKDETYEDHELHYNEAVQLTLKKNVALGSQFDYIYVYFNGNKFLEFSMIEMFSQDTVRNIAHPVVEPDPEHPGDNDDGGYEDNPLLAEPTIEEQPVIVNPTIEEEPVETEAGPSVLPDF